MRLLTESWQTLKCWSNFAEPDCSLFLPVVVRRIRLRVSKGPRLSTKSSRNAHNRSELSYTSSPVNAFASVISSALVDGWPSVSETFLCRALHCTRSVGTAVDGNAALLGVLEETARQCSSSETPWPLILAKGLIPVYRWTHRTGVLLAVTNDQRSTHAFLRAFLQCMSSFVAAMFSLVFRRSFSTELALTATSNALLRPGDIGRGRFIKLRLCRCHGAANFERTR